MQFYEYIEAVRGQNCFELSFYSNNSHFPNQLNYLLL